MVLIVIRVLEIQLQYKRRPAEQQCCVAVTFTFEFGCQYASHQRHTPVAQSYAHLHEGVLSLQTDNQVACITCIAYIVQHDPNFVLKLSQAMCAHTMILISFSSESDMAGPGNKFTALRSKIVHSVCHQLLTMHQIQDTCLV